MGGASGHGIETRQLQLISYLLGCLFLSVLAVSGVYPPISIHGSLLWFSLSCYFGVGVLAFVLNETMARAMERGPNGLVWAFRQSGMLIPFIWGICAHNVKAGAVRLIGMCVLLVALGLMSFNHDMKKKETQGTSWLVLALVTFVLCGFQMIINSEPSYQPEVRDGIPVVYRCLVMEFGTVVYALCVWLYRGFGAWRKSAAVNFRLPWFWVYAVSLQVFYLSATLCLTFNGLDRMAKLGLGALSYPVIVVSCIVWFTLYSFVVLRERLSWKQILDLLCCVGGIAMLSLS